MLTAFHLLIRDLNEEEVTLYFDTAVRNIATDSELSRLAAKDPINIGAVPLLMLSGHVWHLGYGS